MNRVILMGRLKDKIQIKQASTTTVGRFTLAVDRRSRDDQPDWISCVAFGKTAEIIDDWTTKGMKIAISGRIQTGSYTNAKGEKVYTTDVIAEDVELCEKKVSNTSAIARREKETVTGEEEWMQVDELEDAGLPFN